MPEPDPTNTLALKFLYRLVRSLDQHTFWMDASDGRLTPIE
jgi:hypothetical protein